MNPSDATGVQQSAEAQRANLRSSLIISITSGAISKRMLCLAFPFLFYVHVAGVIKARWPERDGTIASVLPVLGAGAGESIIHDRVHRDPADLLNWVLFIDVVQCV